MKNHKQSWNISKFPWNNEKTWKTTKTILFSTHILQEVEAVCDRVLIINEGKLFFDKSMKDLKNSNQQALEVTFDSRIEEELVKRLPGLVSFKNNSVKTWRLVFESKDDMRPIVFDFAKQNGLKILALTSKNQSLENLFNTLTQAQS